MTDSERPPAETRPPAQGPRLFDRLISWFRPDSEGETVRDVIEGLIEERIEERPEDGELIEGLRRIQTFCEGLH